MTTRVSSGRPANLLHYAAQLLGFAVASGMPVRLNIETMGADHEDDEHTVPAGAVGRIDAIDWFGGAQRLAIHVVIPVDDSGERHIVNTFDEADPEPRFPFTPV